MKLPRSKDTIRRKTFTVWRVLNFMDIEIYNMTKKLNLTDVYKKM